MKLFDKARITMDPKIRKALWKSSGDIAGRTSSLHYSFIQTKSWNEKNIHNLIMKNNDI